MAAAMHARITDHHAADPAKSILPFAQGAGLGFGIASAAVARTHCPLMHATRTSC